MSNVSATGFAKTDKDDTSVLLTSGVDRLLSSFVGLNIQHLLHLVLRLRIFHFRIKLSIKVVILMDFPELYAYIQERDPKPPVETAPPVPIGEQTLQEQVKVNADIFENTKDLFVSPEPNMPVKIDYEQQIVNKL
ncbi:MAG: hypothetical protein EZS28_040158 [Streblomastix strix]|uniref:Uncharacterized protein n=1 Tax=Streblomastix strix TaxID=222440 RepID=A0A5J4U3U1_9EUKA|nr:MAG: hypothetical protein EZS28_040158 [Streblomastix strix]